MRRSVASLIECQFDFPFAVAVIAFYASPFYAFASEALLTIRSKLSVLGRRSGDSAYILL